MSFRSFLGYLFILYLININIHISFCKLNYFYADFILILTNSFSLLANIMQFCYKSKCNQIDLCCGMVHIDRNIQAEQDIESGSYHNPDYYYYPSQYF